MGEIIETSLCLRNRKFLLQFNVSLEKSLIEKTFSTGKIQENRKSFCKIFWNSIFVFYDI